MKSFHRLQNGIASVLLSMLAVTLPAMAEVSGTPYRLCPGDTLGIEVRGHPEWSLQGTIRPDGRITYAGLGEIAAAGLSVAELTALVVDALGPGGRHLKNPRVVINTTATQVAQAFILGAVQRPGTVAMATGRETAVKALAHVGGPQQSADLREAVIYRENGTARQVIDLQAQLDGASTDTLLFRGDVMVIPEVKQFVGALGAVARTGQVALRPGQSSIDLVSLLLQLGGLRAEADQRRALILRSDGAVEPVQLEDVLQRRAPMVHLGDGDALWVLPKAEAQYFVVTGAVSTPGRFEYRQDLTLGDALALAGQPTEAAQSKAVTLIHKDGSKQIVDIQPMLQGNDPEMARLAVRPDDIILVPVQHESYAVMGAVVHPGVAAWEDGLRLADVLARAGGVSEKVADVAQTVLVRRVPGAKQPTVIELNARDLLAGRSEAANLVVEPGDMVYVPALAEKGWRQKLDLPLMLLGVVNTLANIGLF